MQVQRQGAPCENTDAQGSTEKGGQELEEGHPESLGGPAVLCCLWEVRAPIPGAGPHREEQGGALRPWPRQLASLAIVAWT